MRQRRLVSILVLCVMAAVVVAGCAQENPIVGQWKMTRVKTNGVEVDLEEAAQMPELVGLDALQLSLDFKDDGTVTAMLGSEDSGNTMNYKVDGDKVTIEGDGESIDLTYDKSANTLTLDGSQMVGMPVSIILTKQGS